MRGLKTGPYFRELTKSGLGVTCSGRASKVYGLWGFRVYGFRVYEFIGLGFIALGFMYLYSPECKAL